MSELSPNEQAFLDEAYQRLNTTRRTFTEKEALHTARLEGYELKLSFDERFARAEPRQGTIPPHWRLAEQALANTRLLNELKAGTWDGHHLDEKLQQLDQEDHPHYTFYPHDPRLFQNRQGAWEATGERQITLPLGLKEELDTFIDRLQARWSALQTPLTIGQILALLEELGWEHETIASVHRCLRAWLLATTQFRRVGIDYWMPAAQLPPEIQRTRLQVSPVRTATGRAEQNMLTEEQAESEQRKKLPGERISFKGTATKAQAVWTTTLRSIHQLEGFIPIPKAVRGIYPTITPGEENTTVLKGLWHDDATDLWIWLDRAHHRLHGPDLLDKIGWLPAGTQLQIEWNTDQIVLRDSGLDPDVQREESRLVDIEELKKLRGGTGENYRQAIQAILRAAPDGLTLKDIVTTLSQRQHHEVARGTVRSILSSSGFIQRELHWFAAPNNLLGAKQLQEALLETLMPRVEERAGEQIYMSHQEYISTRVHAIHKRLQEITHMLSRNVNINEESKNYE
jgi:hypothetical protein